MSKLSKRDNIGISGKRPFAGMSKMRPHAAGLDIGAHEIVGCVPGESDSEFGAFYRRMKSRIGPAQAMVATAHKMARVVFHMLSKGEEYRPLGAAEYEQQFKERQIQFLKRKAAKLGLQVIPT